MQEFLEERDAVDRRFEFIRPYVPSKFIERIEAAHAQAFATLIVLGDEWGREGAGHVQEIRGADDGDRARRIDAELLQKTVLTDLADFHFHDRSPVHNPSPMSFEPFEQCSGV